MINSMAVANIVRVDIMTEENTAVYSLKSANEATIEANVSAGNDNELRVGNQILAHNTMADIVKGYNITFKDTEFSPDVFALVDGGESYGNASNDFLLYASPVAGKGTSRKKFCMYIYTEQKDYDGDTIGYTVWIFPHCVGSPASMSFRDGEFYSPSYTIKSKPTKGYIPAKIANLPSLPKVVYSIGDMPEKASKAPTVNSTILIACNPYSNGKLVQVTVATNEPEETTAANIKEELKTLFSVDPKGNDESNTAYNARVNEALAKIAKGEIAVCKSVTSTTVNEVTTYTCTYKIATA